MLRGEFPDAGERTPESLRKAYESELSSTVEAVGVDAVVAETDLDRETVEALAAGESPEVTLEEAAAVLALDEDRPPADAVAAEARDVLLMGMTTAVLDVETLGSAIDGEMNPKAIQQKIEGRHPITLAEYARLHQAIEERK
ncbi:DUF5791 family protein [Halomicrobium urmianum]|uniref:DUF5791 family protein n=1 Tax=Halomicrobium urmianum TaxID=1586233 RepID=UPI001CD98C39|nr:DUF5791 family protein [Halomicrobium urmianum]